MLTPQKKMKKRKELNALIGLSGDAGRKKSKKGSGHRLLRTEPPDSESESSSDEDEFSTLSSVAAFGKRSYAQCCKICYPLCAFIILAACVMACAGLIWMQIALKEELDSLKEKLHTLETSQKGSSHDIPKLNEDLKEEQKRLELLESGDRGLNKLWSNLTEINLKISLLDSAVSHLKANIKSASDWISLPTTVEELKKSVATIGSTLTSVQHDVRTIQSGAEEQKKVVDELKRSLAHNQTKEAAAPGRADSDGSSCSSVKQEVRALQEALHELNATGALSHSQTDEQLQTLSFSLTSLTQRVSFLENGFLLLNLSKASKPTDVTETTNQQAVSKNGGGVTSAVMVNQDLRDGADSATAALPDEIVQARPSRPTRHPRFLLQSLTRKDQNPKLLSLPGISSMKDLQDVLHEFEGEMSTQGVSYEDLRKIFGSDLPTWESLQAFDKDGNQRFSLSELRYAAGL